MASVKDRSRYVFCQVLTDDSGRTFLSDRVPYRYVKRSDNRVHTVVDGDTLFSLADTYFRPLDRPSQFYWVIADYQPEPIIDASLSLTIGTRIVIPSVRVLVEEIFNESRRAAFGG